MVSIDAKSLIEDPPADPIGLESSLSIILVCSKNGPLQKSIKKLE
jgi:hypothetical protein